MPRISVDGSDANFFGVEKIDKQRADSATAFNRVVSIASSPLHGTAQVRFEMFELRG